MLFFLTLGYLNQDDFSSPIHILSIFNVAFSNIGAILHCANIPSFLYPFFTRGISRLFSGSEYYE